jgi:hypothetical protein
MSAMPRSVGWTPSSTGTVPCAGLGQAQLRETLACEPWYSAISSRHSVRISSTWSRTIARRSSKRCPWSANSARFQP